MDHVNITGEYQRAYPQLAGHDRMVWGGVEGKMKEK